MFQYCNDSVLEVNMFLLPEKLPQKLTQEDMVKWKYKVSCIQPCNCHHGKAYWTTSMETYAWCVIIRLSYYQFAHQKMSL